jgi:hypothetical protein
MDFVVKHQDEIVMLDWQKFFGDDMPLESVWIKMGDEFLIFSLCGTSFARMTLSFNKSLRFRLHR